MNIQEILANVEKSLGTGSIKAATSYIHQVLTELVNEYEKVKTDVVSAESTVSGDAVDLITNVKNSFEGRFVAIETSLESILKKLEDLVVPATTVVTPTPVVAAVDEETETESVEKVDGRKKKKE